MDWQVCVTKTVAYIAWTDRQTDGQKVKADFIYNKGKNLKNILRSFFH